MGFFFFKPVSWEWHAEDSEKINIMSEHGKFIQRGPNTPLLFMKENCHCTNYTTTISTTVLVTVNCLGNEERWICTSKGHLRKVSTYQEDGADFQIARYVQINIYPGHNIISWEELQWAPLNIGAMVFLDWRPSCRAQHVCVSIII